jgi:hypothetical protein
LTIQSGSILGGNDPNEQNTSNKPTELLFLKPSCQTL